MAEASKASAGAPRAGEDRRNWLIAGAGALLAVAFVLWLFSRTPLPPPAAVSARPTRVLGVDRGATDEAELLDPTPLFLPTRWNARPQRVPVGGTRQSETAFAPFPPKLLFDEDGLALSFPPVVATPAKPVEALGVVELLHPLKTSAVAAAIAPTPIIIRVLCFMVLPPWCSHVVLSSGVVRRSPSEATGLTQGVGRCLVASFSRARVTQ